MGSDSVGAFADEGSTMSTGPKSIKARKTDVHTSQVNSIKNSEDVGFYAERPQNLDKGWATLARTLTEYDEIKVRDCKEDMDTLLVFAGLFSAVLTAFNIETYKNLQQDSSETIVLVLTQISLQLQSFSLNPSFVNSTQPSFVQPAKFQPAQSFIRINTLWFSALIISLVTASLAMLIKQWLREYMAEENLSPRSQIRVRYWRNQGLIRWHVFEIAAILPILLQLSLVLFFAGLCVFLQDLNRVVGLVSTILVATWLFLYISSISAPVFSSKCPYKTPLLKYCIRSLRLFSRSFSRSQPTNNVPLSLLVRDDLAMRQDSGLDLPSLIAADATLQDDDFIYSTVRSCLADLGGRDVTQWVLKAIVRRTGRVCNNLLEVRFTDFRQLTLKCRLSLVHILIDGLCFELDRRLHAKRSVDWIPWMSGALRCIGSGLLPMFRASDRQEWLEVGNRAGKLLVELFGQNEQVARNVLENLSYSIYPRLPSSYIIPEITSPYAWSNILNAATLCVGSNQIQPAQLCQVTLYLALHVPDNVLQESCRQFQSLMLDFAAMLRGHISRGTEVAEWNHLTTLSLEHIASLVARHPNIIGDELTEVLAQLTSGSQNLSAPGPA